MIAAPTAASKLLWSDLLVAGAILFAVSMKAAVIVGIGDAPEVNPPEWAGFLTGPTPQILALLVELTVVLALAFPRTRSIGRLACLLLVCAFMVFYVLLAATGGPTASCGCFGATQVSPAAHFLILVGMGLLTIVGVERSGLMRKGAGEAHS